MKEEILNELKPFVEDLSKISSVASSELMKVLEDEYSIGEDLYSKYEGEEKKKALMTYLKIRLKAYVLKIQRMPLQEVEFLPIFIDSSDFGALRQYLKAKEEWEKNPEVAIKEELTDSNGNPLYQSGFRKGQLINLDEAATKTYEGFVKTDIGLKKAYLTVRGLLTEKIILNLGTVYKLKVIRLQKSTNEEDYYSVTDTTKPVEVSKLGYEKIVELLKQYYSDRLTTLKDIEQFYSDRVNNPPVFAILKGAVLDIRETNDRVENGVTIKKSNVLELFSPDSSNTVVCWVPKIKELEFKFMESATDLIVAGILNYREDSNSYQLSRVMAIYYPEEFEKPETPNVGNTEVEEVDEVEEKLKIVEDVVSDF